MITNQGRCTLVGIADLVCPIGRMGVGEVRQVDITFFIKSVRLGTVVNLVYVNDPNAVDVGGGGEASNELPSDPKGPTAVTLNQFVAVEEGGALVVTWQTSQEIDTWAFQLWRSTVNDRTTAQMVTSNPILAMGGGATYQLVDNDVQPGVNYFYWLQEISINGVLKEIEMITGKLPEAGPAAQIFLPTIHNGVPMPAASEGSAPRAVPTPAMPAYTPLPTVAPLTPTPLPPDTPTPLPPDTPTPLPPDTPTPLPPDTPAPLPTETAVEPSATVSPTDTPAEPGLEPASPTPLPDLPQTPTPTGPLGQWVPGPRPG